LQSLINTQDAENPEDRLTTKALIEETILFLVAGSETTSNSINFAIIELLRHPEKLAKLYQEIDAISMQEGEVAFHHDQLKKIPYLNGVINETLRLDPVAAGGLQRYTTEDIALGSHLTLPKDVNILLL
jgi:cytochrome P450